MIVQAMPYPAASAPLTPQPNWANVVFLSGWEGANNSNTYADESSFARAVAEVDTGGNMYISTTNPKFGSSSLFRSNTVSEGYVYCADSDSFNFGSGPFTIETWVRFSRSTATSIHYLIAQWDTGANQRSWALAVNAGVLTLNATSAGTTANQKIAVAWAPTLGVWYHVAADFDGTTYRVYVDGVMLGSATGVVTLHNSTARMSIGAALNNNAFNGTFGGFLDETRIVKGQAVYASDTGFAVPTSAFPRG